MDDFDLSEFLVEDTIPDEGSEEIAQETAEEETENSGESDKASETPTTEKPAESQEPETVEYKFNHTVTPLDKKAMQSIADALGVDITTLTAQLQKGAGYDAKASKLEALERTLDSYAGKLNMDRSGVFKILESAGDRAAIRGIAAQVKAMHPDWTDDAILEVSNLKLAEQKQRALQDESERRRQESEAANRPLVDFFLHHPDITPDNMPDEMKQDIFGGLTPEEAFSRHETRQKEKELQSLKEELSRIQQQNTNKAKAIGSATSEVGEKTDDLSAAFLSVFK